MTQTTASETCETESCSALNFSLVEFLVTPNNSFLTPDISAVHPLSQILVFVLMVGDSFDS